MKGVLTAEPAILLEFKTIRIILLILCRVVISLFAFAANECYFHSHSVHLPVNLSVLPPSTWKIFARLIRKNTHNKKTPPTEVNRLYHFYSALSSIFIVFTINFSTFFIKKTTVKTFFRLHVLRFNSLLSLHSTRSKVHLSPTSQRNNHNSTIF